MSDDDMISKTAALEAVKRETGFDDDHPAIAAIAALPAVTVGVRPLVWVDGECLGDPVYTAGGYTIDDDGDDADHDLRFLLTMPASGGLRFPTLEAAKAVAQADYEARVRGEVILTPAPDAAVKRVVDLLDNLTERQWVIDGLTVSELKEITDAIGAVREVQSHKSK